MEKQNTNFTAKTKKARFEIQKNIHIFMREMMRYYDIYLLIGTVSLKSATIALFQYTSKAPNVIIGLLCACEFFFMFTRIGQEYQRAKKQTTIYAETISMRGKYIAIIYAILVLGGLFNEFTLDSLLQGLVCGLIYYISNMILAAASVTIHTKDAQFSAKYIKGKPVVILNSKAEPKIIEERKEKRFEEPTEKEEENQNLTVEQAKKKYSNMKAQLKRVQERKDSAGAQKEVDKIKSFLDDLYDDKNPAFSEIRKNWLTIEY